MTKEKIKISLIIGSVILLLPVLIYVLLSVGWTKFGPFHHSAIVDKPTDVVKLNNRYFCLIDGYIYELEDDKFKMCNFNYERDENLDSYLVVNSIAVNNDKLYVSTSDDIIYVFSSELVQLKRINLDVDTFLVKGDSIYYYSTGYKRKVVGEYNEKTEQIIEFNVETNVIYNFENESVFYSNKDSLHFSNEEKNVFSVQGVTYNSDELNNYRINKYFSFCYDNKVGEVLLENQTLTILFNGKSLEFTLPANQSLYDTAKLHGDELFFATHDNLISSKCLENRGNCICRFGKAKLWKFNINSLTLTGIKEFESGSFLINFDKSGYTYYRNGEIYRNDVKIRSVDIVEPIGEFYQLGDRTFKEESIISKTLFFDTGTQLFYTHSVYDVKDSY